MGFGTFCAAIRSDALRAVARHWEDARGGRSVPAWRDIDPVEIGRNLRYVWSWRYDRATDSFTGRLAGEEIDRAFGKSLRGVPMRDFYAPDIYDLVYPRHRRVAVEPGFMHGYGMIFAHMGRSVVGERIVMPLAEDGRTGDGILGATIYRPIPHAERPLGPDFKPEQVTFFPLG
jgi:hypothetical protein